MATQFPQTLKMWVFAPRKPAQDTSGAVVSFASVRPVTFPATDDRLLESLRARRPDAWLHFYDTYAAYVHSVLQRVLGRDSELEDLLQDVFTRALEGVDRVREADKLKAWLRGLTVFTARERLRRNKWRKWLPLGNSDDEGGVPCPTTTDALDERLLLRKVNAVLASLSVDDRLAFSLRHFEGLELTEVALTLKMSLSTAKRRISRAEAEFKRRAGADRDLRACFAEGTVFS
jgi:RNA polymerase sigma-70 factor, ECF subfamily